MFSKLKVRETEEELFLIVQSYQFSIPVTICKPQKQNLLAVKIIL
jgi:hypothetical protein